MNKIHIKITIQKVVKKDVFLRPGGVSVTGINYIYATITPVAYVYCSFVL